MYDKALNLIQKFEGFEPNAYLCPAGVWTIGYGETHNVKEGDTITQEEATKRLSARIGILANQITDCVETDLNENMLCALISFVYNIGLGAFKMSTMLKLLNAGDKTNAANEFDKWVYAKKKVLPGLVERRKAEKELFLA